MKLRGYKVYGLIVNSYKELFGVVEYDNATVLDVEIVNEKIEEEKKNMLTDERWLYYSKEFSCFRIKDVATFCIENGNKITIEEHENANDDIIRAFILGTSFGFLMEQRNIIAIHGAAIQIDEDSTIIVTGRSGAGKSSLTAGFRMKEYKFLSDDVSALTIEETVLVNPSYPCQKICGDMMDQMGILKKDHKYIDENRDKYLVKDTDGFVDIPKRLNAIYQIIPNENIDDCELIEVTGYDKITTILKNIYREEIFAKFGFDKNYFKSVVKLANSIKVYKLYRPENMMTINNQIELIKESIKQKTLIG
ncbi:MAG: hypothetical protein ACRC57_13500 [Sarcina sp.]